MAIDSEKYLNIGEVYREHGLQGECKFYAYSHDSINLASGQDYTLESVNGQVQTVQITSVHPFKRYFLVQFDCFKTPEDLIQWRKAKLWLSKDLLSRDDEDDDLYDFEWEGFEVFDASDCLVGKVTQVVHNPMPQWTLATANGETLIPMVSDWVLDLDKEAKTIKLDLPEGLV